ncbi:transglycosylase-like protein with SLT domain [Hydromonas duriensis]|uniref:Transglycosylase-like protein with SLT domain n=2 Tax=Hydromonas duriensis TaxID=1527608 RepID=A0A4V3DJX3_9BURK|nr:transglycosylase-like protein with SLT domain [Hydromonas duriensis]
MLIAAPARAGGLYVYVDEQGIPHYSLQKLDERYQLFANDGPVLSDDVVLATTEPTMQANLPDMAQYAGISGKRGSLLGNDNSGRMSIPNNLNIPAPSKAVLTRLLKSPSMARYEPIIIKHARKNGVDVNLVKAVMAAESGFNATAISPKAAMGLMQVIAPTAARYGVSEAQLMNPERNIYAGVRYLADLSRMFKGRPELVIAAYNAGEGAVYKYNRQIPPYKETQNYVRTVLQFYNVYAPKAGSPTLIVSDDDTPAMASKYSRRGMQRVKMRIGTTNPKKSEVWKSAFSL